MMPAPTDRVRIDRWWHPFHPIWRRYPIPDSQPNPVGFSNPPVYHPPIDTPGFPVSSNPIVHPLNYTGTK